MNRGEIWTASGAGGYAGKPRPVVIVQDDQFDATASIAVCGLTTNPAEAPILRIAITPNDHNGLREPCRIMVDKIATVPKTNLGARIGRLDDEDIVKLNRAIVVFLGLTTRPRTQSRATKRT